MFVGFFLTVTLSRARAETDEINFVLQPTGSFAHQLKLRYPAKKSVSTYSFTVAGIPLEIEYCTKEDTKELDITIVQHSSAPIVITFKMELRHPTTNTLVQACGRERALMEPGYWTHFRVSALRVSEAGITDKMILSLAICIDLPHWV